MERERVPCEKQKQRIRACFPFPKIEILFPNAQGRAVGIVFMELALMGTLDCIKPGEADQGIQDPRVFPLMIPCFDVVRVFAYRLLHGNNPFLPDSNHIHHRLMRAGLSVRTTMTTIILSSTLLTLTNVMLCNDLGVMLLLAADITLWIVVNIIIDLLLKRKEKKLTTH